MLRQQKIVPPQKHAKRRKKRPKASTEGDPILASYLSDITNSNPLSSVQEAELACRIRAGDEEARNELINYREKVISVTHRQTPRNRGILRRTMLELLLTHLPTNREQFRTEIPDIFKEQTEKDQIDLHIDHILSVLARISE